MPCSVAQLVPNHDRSCCITDNEITPVYSEKNPHHGKDMWQNCQPFSRLTDHKVETPSGPHGSSGPPKLMARPTFVHATLGRRKRWRSHGFDLYLCACHSDRIGRCPCFHTGRQCYVGSTAPASVEKICKQV